MEKLGSRFGKGRGVATVDGEVACEACPQLHHPARRRAPMTRIAALSDVHGNIAALEAVLADVDSREARLRSWSPATSCSTGRSRRPWSTPCARRRQRGAAVIVQGNTDIAVADFDYAAAFPWMTDGVPDAIVAAAEWAHDALGDERVDWLRRLPSERRLRTDDDTLVLVCHASPGSQTPGFDQDLDPSVTIERLARTDARVIVCGHTHLPEVRDLGWKVIVNDGSAGYVFDGDPTASWALVDIDGGEVTRRDPADRVRRAGGRQRHLRARPAGRRLSRRHRPNGQAGPMSGRGRVGSSSPGWAWSRRSATTSPSTWAGLVAGRSGVRTIDAFDPSRLTVQIAGRGARTSTRARVIDRKDQRRMDRYIQFGLVAAREAMDQAGLPARLEGELAERTGVILGTGLGGVGTLVEGITTNVAARPGPDQPVPHPDGHPERRRRARSPSASG